MNNPNPFVPKGSLLEQQSQRRSRLKLAVFCVLAVSVTGLVAMLIQGCKRENPEANSNPPADTNTLALGMPTPPPADTNTPPPMAPMASNTAPVIAPPVAPPPAVVPPPVEPAAGSDYVIVAGDTLAKIAKAHGVSLKALEAANPGVDPKKLKIKQKLVIPAPTPSTGTATATAAGTPDTGGETYTVKSGDNLSKIAKKNGVSLKALKAANNLTTDHIKVGDKLKIPAKAETAAPAPAPAPDTSAAPALPPVSAPAPAAPAPAPGH
jgi:LysM repeat protein